MSKKIVISQIKGGVGKTTTAVNIADQLASKGKSVVLLDCDPQGNSSQHNGITDCDGTAILKAIITPTYTNIDGLVHETPFKYDIIPAGMGLALAPKEFDKRRKGRRPQFYIKEFIAQVEKFYLEPWDYWVIDTPPTPSLITVNAHVAADFIIFPAETAYFSMQGMAEIYNEMQAVMKEYNADLKFAVLPSRYMDDKTDREILAELKEALPGHILSPITHNEDVKAAPRTHQPVSYYNKRSKSNKEFKNLVNELEKRL